MQGKVSSLCLVVDDSVFLTIAIAHLSKTSHVIALFPGLREKGAKYLQAVAVANGFSMDQIEVLGKRKDKLTMHDTHQKKVISRFSLYVKSDVTYTSNFLKFPCKMLQF